MEKESYYTISIPPYIVKEVGFEISVLKLKSLADMIYKVFENDLFSYIEVSVGSELKFVNEEYQSINKQNVVNAIQQFLRFYDINEDDLNPESLYRTFYRNQKSDKNKKNKIGKNEKLHK